MSGAFFTVAQVAEQTGFSARTVLRWVEPSADRKRCPTWPGVARLLGRGREAPRDPDV
jgi:hypothetical protein